MMIRTAPACVATLSLLLPTIPVIAHAGECPSPSSEIATDRPDVTNSSLVVPVGALQGENGINTTGHGPEKTFDGTNSRLRLGIAPCLEVLVDLPNYIWGFRGPADGGFSNVVPAVKWQLNSLPEPWNLSVTAGAGLPTGATRIAGLGAQPYLQFPWSHELGNGWGTSGMFTTFFFPSDPFNRQ
ncbi:MAG TPA: transporter, partial [Bradyrhizobium sp.]